MSHRDDCPTDWEARREGERAYERGYGSNPYRGNGWDERSCPEAERAFDYGRRQAEYRHEEQMAEERSERRRAEARREEQEQEDAYYQQMMEQQYQEQQQQPEEPPPEEAPPPDSAVPF